MKIIRENNFLELRKIFEEPIGKECPAFNYEDFPYAAQAYVDYLKKLITEAEQKK